MNHGTKYAHFALTKITGNKDIKEPTKSSFTQMRISITSNS